MGEFAARIGVGVLRLLAQLPLPVLRLLGMGIGELTYWLAVPRRRVALRNLEACMPALSAAERRRLARRHFRCFMASFLERFVFWTASPERIRRIVRIVGREHFDAQRGRPVLMLAAHFVGIDAGGTRFALETGFIGMYAQQKSRVLTEVMTRGRTRFGGVRMILRNEGVRVAVRAMREGMSFYLLPDMDLGARDSVFVPFFGVPAATVTSAARLARITGAAVVPAITRMTREGYEIRFYPAWDDFPGTDDVAAVARMNAFIEARILEMPEQYLWTHRRFKTRPPGEPDFYRR